MLSRHSLRKNNEKNANSSQHKLHRKMSCVSLPESTACSLGLFCLYPLPFWQKHHNFTNSAHRTTDICLEGENRVSCGAQRRMWSQSKTVMGSSSNYHSVICQLCYLSFWSFLFFKIEIMTRSLPDVEGIQRTHMASAWHVVGLSKC